MDKDHKTILLSAEGHFRDLVREGLQKRKIKTHPHIETYLVEVLENHLLVKNLFQFDLAHIANSTTEVHQSSKNPSTFAELYLLAMNSDHSAKTELLKKLGDRSLYFCGFFSPSLQKRLVDVDYYLEMGELAFTSLSNLVKENTVGQIYTVIAKRFVEFVDVLEYISHKSLTQENQDLLRLYEKYLRTGSELARESLIESGIITIPREHGHKKYSKSS